MKTNQKEQKNQNTNKPQPSNQQIIDSYDYLSDTVSSQDCTGLIPSGPVDEAQRESYEAIYHYQPPKEKVLPIDGSS